MRASVRPGMRWVWLALLLNGAVRLALAGGIEYPALGHFDPQQGTLEVWFTPMVADLYPVVDAKSYRGGFALFAMSVPEHFSFAAGWGSKAQQHGIFISLQAPLRDKALLSVIGPAAPGWKEGQLHHVAFTWKERDMRVFLDGRAAGRRNQAQGFAGRMAGQTLTIGSREGRDTRIIVHAVRLSSIAREERLLDPVAPRPDIYTTLLDVFDRGPTAGRTVPRQTSGLGADERGTLRGHWTWVEVPRRGLALYKQAK